MHKPAIRAGAIFGALAVILGAFGAHALKNILEPSQLQTFETAVKYQFYHSFALLAVGIMYGYIQSKQLKLASIFFIIGTILFSGSLYTLIFLKKTMSVGLGGIGILTPIGGLFFIAGWLCILLAASKR
jgi:uncharacterized membrane protein YgdD (TMEM256/DUF423 family)